MMEEYYAQRGCTPGTMLITEATFVVPQAGGYDFVPGLWDPEQLRAWKKVTDAVHAKGSYIVCQLWALGRAASAKVMTKEGLEVISSSSIPITPKSSVPRPMSKDEIWNMVGGYAMGARNAVFEAGFDGVEIHGANGYLVDQFTQDTCNDRTDEWGGSVENRCRFAVEVTKACIAAVGKERVGIRLSPYNEYQGMLMKDPKPTFTYLINELAKLDVMYLHMTTPRIQGTDDAEHPTKYDMDWAIETWPKQKPLILCGAYTKESGTKEVDHKWKDHVLLLAIGRHFISTPDLPYRWKKGIEWNKYNRGTFYKAMSEEGYIDYPFSSEFLADSKASL
jgi:NADPH2 dehydrogenase